MKAGLLILAAVASTCLCGCANFVYRVVQPPVGSLVVGEHPVEVKQEPLNYVVVRNRDRLSIRIDNPTTQSVVLVGARSVVVDPKGESHPVRGQIIGPRSYAWLVLPPWPITYAYPDYYWGWGPAWGWGWGWGPYWGPYYSYPFYGPPPVSYHQLTTAYDWTWKTGPARLHLAYESNGKAFEHSFEFIREEEKK